MITEYSALKRWRADYLSSANDRKNCWRARA